MEKKVTKRDYISLSLISVIFIVSMIGFSCYTSPLYPNCFGWDSAIFSLLGKGMVEGKGLYTELFDHKGPVIFMIDALGHLLGGRTGIFLLQCISGLITVYFLYFTGKMLRPQCKYKWVVEAIFLFVCVELSALHDGEWKSDRGVFFTGYFLLLLFLRQIYAECKRKSNSSQTLGYDIWYLLRNNFAAAYEQWRNYCGGCFCNHDLSDLQKAVS
ncbi:MAG: hypothetical protein E7420_01715 [Ruminococcaceae bacterium]|nr:hypothetical protein [Oscillospiraceae bacterium]